MFQCGEYAIVQGQDGNIWPSAFDSLAHNIEYDLRFEHLRHVSECTYLITWPPSLPSLSIFRLIISVVDFIKGYTEFPFPHQLQSMNELLEEAFKIGYFGLSTGLEYLPGGLAKEEELRGLAKTVGEYHALIMAWDPMPARRRCAVTGISDASRSSRRIGRWAIRTCIGFSPIAGLRSCA